MAVSLPVDHHPTGNPDANGRSLPAGGDSLLSLAPHFSLHPLTKGRFLLFSEDRSVKLNDAFYSEILPLLDGRWTGRQIVAQLAERAGKNAAPELEVSELKEYISGFLLGMIEKKYVVALDPHGHPARTALLAASGLDPAEAGQKLGALQVAVLPLGQDGAAGSAATADLTAMLIAEGIGVRDADSAPVVVVVVEDYLQPALETLARRFSARGQTWIPFKPGGARIGFGPVFAPGGACYACLSRRMLEHRPGDQFATPSPLGARPAKGWTRASLAMAYGLATRELAAYGLGRRREIEEYLLSWTVDDGRRERHPVPRFPDCPVCGSADTVAHAAQPVRLADDNGALKELDGGWRVLSQEEALARLEKIVSPLTGIVARCDATHPGDGLYVYSATQGANVPADPRQNRRLGRPGGAAGKGLTDMQAKISCLAEATERYSAQWTGAEARRLARWADLSGAAPHPAALLEFSEHQYDNRESLNEQAGEFGQIPLRFREDAMVEWTPAWSLRDDAARWLPTRYCYYDYKAADVPEDHAFCHSDSNGCAAGGSLEEAILQGFLEVVERDAISMWWYNRLRLPAIELTGLDDAFVRRMQAHYGSLGRSFHILDLTTDLGIPVAVAISATHEGKSMIVGFGAHLDGRTAALRALAELNQILRFDGMDRMDRKHNHLLDSAMWNWLDRETVETQPYMVPAEGKRVSMTDYPERKFATIAEAVRYCVDLVAADHDFIVHDLSRPDLPVNCVRVVVPGLRHFWNRRAPGRLYDLPVKMGWLDKPRLESELNPIGFFL